VTEQDSCKSAQHGTFQNLTETFKCRRAFKFDYFHSKSKFFQIQSFYSETFNHYH